MLFSWVSFCRRFRSCLWASLWDCEEFWHKGGWPGRARRAAKERSSSWTYMKISNSARGVGSKALHHRSHKSFEELVLIFSFPCSLVLFLSLVFLIPLFTKQRLSWHQCAPSSDFWELWVKAFMRNLELSCASPAHFPKLSSLHCMCDLGQVWQELQPWKQDGCRNPLIPSCLSAPVWARKAAEKQEISALGGKEVTRTQLQLWRIKMNLLG